MTELLNGPVESGLRALAILSAVHPRRLDVGELVLLDYIVVHSGDVAGGPDSLHPPSPLRSGEVTIRRALIEDGLSLYRSRSLVERHFGKDGITYGVGDFAGAFLGALISDHVQALRHRASWLARAIAGRTIAELRREFAPAFERWRQEFEALGDLDETDGGVS